MGTTRIRLSRCDLWKIKGIEESNNFKESLFQ